MDYKYVKRSSSKAKKTPGSSYVAKGTKPKLGSGKRFSALEGVLKKKGVSKPSALAAWIGRKNLGKVAFQKLSTKATKRSK